jgi:hypothetical protein
LLVAFLREKRKNVQTHKAVQSAYENVQTNLISQTHQSTLQRVEEENRGKISLGMSRMEEEEEERERERERKREKRTKD